MTCRGDVARRFSVAKTPEAGCADNRPGKIVERHRPAMRVASEEIPARPPAVMGISHGIDLVAVRRHPSTSAGAVGRTTLHEGRLTRREARALSDFIGCHTASGSALRRGPDPFWRSTQGGGYVAAVDGGDVGGGLECHRV